MNPVPPSEDEAGSECDERSLIDLAKAGDQTALGRLFDDHYRSVYRYLLVKTAHAEDAEDLAQEVFLRMCSALDRFQHRGIPFRPWLMTIARNLLNDYYRKRGSSVPTVSLDAAPFDQYDVIGDQAPGPEQAVEIEFTLAEIGSAMQVLTELEREVIRLRYAAELSILETALALNKNENNIKQLTFKALGKLRKAMDQGNAGRTKERHERALAGALAASIDAVQSGKASVSDCLSRYPELAPELEPLLQTSARMQSFHRAEPRDQARLRARAAFLGAAAARQTQVVPHPIVRRRGWLAFAPVLIAAALFAVIAVPVVGSMDTGAVPGDWNYGFKRATERVRLALTTDSNDRRSLRLEFAKRRLNEIEFLSNHSQQIDSHKDQVTVLLHDYTSDIKQVNDGLQSASAVPDSAKQQIANVAQQANAVLPAVASTNNAPADDVQQAVTVTEKTEATALAAPVTAPKSQNATAARPPKSPSTAATIANTSTPPPTEAPTPAPAASTPPPEPAATATPAQATSSPAPMPSATPSPTIAPPSQLAQVIPPPATAEPVTPVPAPTRAVTTAPVIVASPARTAAPVVTGPSSGTGATTSAGTITSATPGAGAATSAGTTTAPAGAAEGSITAAPRTVAPPPVVAPEPVATRTPTPVPPPTSVAPRPVATLTTTLEMVTSGPGTITYRWMGAETQLDAVLPLPASQVAAVYYTQQNGVPGTWYPSKPAPSIGLGTLFTIVLASAPATPQH